MYILLVILYKIAHTLRGILEDNVLHFEKPYGERHGFVRGDSAQESRQQRRAHRLEVLRLRVPYAYCLRHCGCFGRMSQSVTQIRDRTLSATERSELLYG